MKIKSMPAKFLAAAATLLFWHAIAAGADDASRKPLDAQKVQELTKEAYVWGYPIVENYKSIYSYGGIDPTMRMYTPFNSVKSMNVFYDYTVTSVVSGNNDT